METVKLDVQARNTISPVNQLRRDRIIPAIFYGQGEKSMPIQMDYQTFRKVYMKAGSSTLVDLSVDGKGAKKVLIHELQFHPLSGEIQHVDFLMVNLKEEITTEVPVEIIGESPAVKDLGGVLNTVKNEITVKCLPTNIPSHIDVDISVLAEFSSAIRVSDLVVSDDVAIQDNEDDVVVTVAAPREEEVEAPVVTEGEEGAEEGAEGEAKEGEEGEEGEKTEGEGEKSEKD